MQVISVQYTAEEIIVGYGHRDKENDQDIK